MKVAVVGLGHVGLPLAVLLARTHTVVGLEADRARAKAIAAGSPGLDEPGLEPRLAEALRSGRFSVTTEPSAIADCAVKVVTVGTPYERAKHRPDLRQLRSALRSVLGTLRRGDVVVLKSTVGPGTTSGTVAKAIRARGLRVPEDVGVVFSPERMIEGRAIEDFLSLPKIVGASDDRSFELARELLGPLGGELIRVRDPTTAELVKMVDNYARHAFLAVTNELALIAPAFGADVYEVLRAARQNYPRNAGLLVPGPGVGGSCLNKDPFHLSDSARRKGVPVRVTAAAAAVNEGMPGEVVRLLAKAAGRRRDVLVAGVAFKGETDDTRYTPAEPVGAGLKRRGYRVRYTDPYVRSWPAGPVRPDVYAEAKDQDAVVILSDHDAYRSLDLPRLAAAMHPKPALVDARNLVDPARALAAGFRFVSLGRP
jgi:nucleotide sugar dehydrogenase